MSRYGFSITVSYVYACTHKLDTSSSNGYTLDKHETILIQRGWGAGGGIPSSRNSSNKGKFRSFRGAYFDRRANTRAFLEFHLFPCDRCCRARNTYRQATLQNLSSTLFREQRIPDRDRIDSKGGVGRVVITGFERNETLLDSFFLLSNRLLFVRWNTSLE